MRKKKGFLKVAFSKGKFPNAIAESRTGRKKKGGGSESSKSKEGED